MTVLGITSLGHDASVALVEQDGTILFAGHAERYSRVKNDGVINQALIDDALRYGTPSEIVWYERPWLKKSRMAYAGQWDGLATPSLRQHIDQFEALERLPISRVGHHEAHALAGFASSPFKRAFVLVVDAIGEWDTTSLWKAGGHGVEKLWSQRYPHSLGLLYSAFTQRCGFKPNEEEYILMGMAAYGEPKYAKLIREDLFEHKGGLAFRLKQNVHRGLRWWHPEITDVENIAASIQLVVEEYLIEAARHVRETYRCEDLVLMGGVALNCVANAKIMGTSGVKNLWIMPNPGDAGSSLGAAASRVEDKLQWLTPYLGYAIDRPFDRAGALEALRRGEVIGLANGRAEFGPRALGNRSLLTDPRGPDTKDRVNQIKRRELFRPFAPVIMDEFANEYFEMPVGQSPYMQFVAKVRRPDLFPAITHVDGTARVQTLMRRQNPQLYQLLWEFNAYEGCPMLLNTSLNIKGEPLVNTWEDAQRFAALHGVKMF